MWEICPICGSRDVKTVDKTTKKYKCASCDATFTLEEKPAVKEVIRTVVKKQIEKGADAFSAKDVYIKNIDCIVEVAATFGVNESYGTGFYISADGYLITNAHVVINIKNKKPVLCDGVSVCKSRSTDFLNAEIVYLDAQNDLALLKVSAEKRKSVSFSKKDVEVGDKVFAIGNSLGDGLNLLDGIVGDLNRNFKSTKAFLFNALVTHGCSGGPVFNDKGEVCGVTVGGSREVAGFNYAIPVSTLTAFILRAKKEKSLTI